MFVLFLFCLFNLYSFFGVGGGGGVCVCVCVCVWGGGGQSIFCYIKNLNLVWGVLQIFSNQYKCKHIKIPLSAHQALHR